MMNWLKDHFVPHAGNEHKPHVLRTHNAGLVLAFVLMLELVYLSSAFIVLPKSSYLAAVISSVLVDETNEVRRANGITESLTINPILVAAAQAKADDMAKRGYFSHNTPEGREPWYFLGQVGYVHDAAGENLAVNFTESSDVTRAWLNSPGHKANLLNGRYTEIGIATAQGVYKGKDAIFVVQFFGRPSARTIASIVPVVEASELLEQTPTTTLPLVVAKTATSLATTSDVNVKSPLVLASATTTASTTKAIATSSVSRPKIQFFDSSLDETVATPSVKPVSETNIDLGVTAKVVNSPRAISNMIFLFILLLICIALIFLVFKRGRDAHYHLLMNGILITLFIIVLLLINTLVGGIFGEV